MREKHAINSLAALAHEGRLDLFRRLVRAGPEGCAAGDLASDAGINFTTASARLSALAQAELITNRRNGRSIIYSVDYQSISKLIAFLMEDCCQGRAEIISPLAALTEKLGCCPSIKEN